ncbi:hypothetical protein DOY81_008140, partial [Sarcophaga bullata]
ATSSLLPYLTIHMQSIGLTVEEIAIIYLALPFTTFLSPPITGFLVDKFGKYKPVVVMSLLLNAIFHHSLLFIPQQEIPGVVPSAFVMRHPDSGDIEVWWSPCPSRECPEEPELELAVNQCVDYCLLQQTTSASTLFTPSTEYYDTRTTTTTQNPDFSSTISTSFISPSPSTTTSSTTTAEAAAAVSLAASTLTPTVSIATPLAGPEAIATATPTPTSTAATAAPTTRSIFQDVLKMSATMFPPVVTSLSSMSMLEQQDWNHSESIALADMDNITVAVNYSWVHSNASDSTFFMLQMHPDLADPIEQLGMEIEQDDNETADRF